MQKNDLSYRPNLGLGKDGLIIMNMCGRGDKDVFTIADALGEHISEGTEG